MGILGDRFREEMRKSKDPRMAEATGDVLYPTGFPTLDYLNGYKVHVVDHNGVESFYNALGIVDGSSVEIIGRSGSGKTTLAWQMAGFQAHQFPEAIIFADDIEGGSNMTRREILTGFHGEELDNKIIYRNAAVTAETFYKRIHTIYEEKMNNRDLYEYNTGFLNSRGEPIYKLIPTIYILDSLAMLTTDKLTELDELSGQMGATSIAKSNTSVFKGIIPKLKAANIMLYSINHINDKIEINAFKHTKATIAGLKPGETLPGGRAAQYLANNLIRVDDGAVLKESEGLGISGKIVDVSFVKSRTNSTLNRSVPMVFTADRGFDPVLSLFMFLKSVGGIEMKGSTCVLKDHEDMKFTQKGFLEKLRTDNEFAKAFNEVGKVELEKLLASNNKTEEIETSYNNIVSSFY